MVKSIAVKKMIKTLIILIGIIVFIIYALPLVAGILNAGNLFGMAVGVCICLLGRFYTPISAFITGLLENKIYKSVFIIVLILIVAGIGLFSATLISVVRDSKYSATDEKTVITLGCRVRGDVPSLQLQARCRETAKYLEKNPDAVAILSGGQGPDENISEAQCMYNLITEAGIEGNRLYIEDKSTSTDENISFSKKIIDDNNLSGEIIVVSSEYHLKRAKMICKKNGLTASAIPAGSSFYSLPTFYTREVFAVWAQWIK